jgi:phosphate transport system substrate-binding protein
MKVKDKKNNELRKSIALFDCRKPLVILLALTLSFGLKAQNPGKTITISGSRFANSLVEKWADEYVKANAGVSIQFVKGDVQGDLSLTVSNDEKSDKKFVNVAQIAVLPVVSEKNTIFGKQLKNGVTREDLKNVFIEGTLNHTDEETKASNAFTVYTQPSHSATTKVVLSYLGGSVSEIPGVIVTGDDKYLIESVLSDSTGVSYGNIGFIYDLASRAPVKGIRILPIDPDNNGKLKKEEQIYDNLDQLMTFLENTKPKTIPTSYVGFSFNQKESNAWVADFVNWVKLSGQQFNHQYGFLKASDEKDPALTQK